MSDVGVLAGCVHHQEQVVADIGHHEVIEYAADIVGELRVAHPSRCEARDIGGNQFFQCHGRVVTAQGDLSHVRHIEYRRQGARVVMLAKNPCRILHRHFVACKRYHLAALIDMKVVKRCFFQIGCFSPDDGTFPPSCFDGPSVLADRKPTCPLCRDT